MQFRDVVGGLVYLLSQFMWEMRCGGLLFGFLDWAARDLEPACAASAFERGDRLWRLARRRRHHPLRVTEHGSKRQEETFTDLIAAAAGIILGQRGRGAPVVILRGIAHTSSDDGVTDITTQRTPPPRHLAQPRDAPTLLYNAAIQPLPQPFLTLYGTSDTPETWWPRTGWGSLDYQPADSIDHHTTPAPFPDRFVGGVFADHDLPAS